MSFNICTGSYSYQLNRIRIVPSPPQNSLVLHIPLYLNLSPTPTPNQAATDLFPLPMVFLDVI